MSTDNRIATLEQALLDASANIQRQQRAMEILSGKMEATQAALLAMIASHPTPELLEPVLNQYAQHLEANAVASRRTDIYVDAIKGFEGPMGLAIRQAFESKKNASF